MGKVLITGGCGYVGSVLVPSLLRAGFQLKVIDQQWFGNFLPREELNLEVLKKGVDAITQKDLDGVDSVIHLANVANDPGVELNPVLSWEINNLHLTQLLLLCKKTKINKFIYASSGSVYGIKSEERVTEDLLPEPISVYNKTKMVAERVTRSFKDDFKIFNVRPATVCGYSPRMRLDVVVNMFVWQAFSNKTIKVLGGDQIRPNINIHDMAQVYLHFLMNDNLEPGDFNAGFENLTVREIAESVVKKCGGRIDYFPSNDPRSYRQDSTKLLNTGFQPKNSVEDAIEEVWMKLENRELVDDVRWHTVKSMKLAGL